MVSKWVGIDLGELEVDLVLPGLGDEGLGRAGGTALHQLLLSFLARYLRG